MIDKFSSLRNSKSSLFSGHLSAKSKLSDSRNNWAHDSFEKILSIENNGK